MSSFSLSLCYFPSHRSSFLSKKLEESDIYFNETIFTPMINDYINTDEANEQDEINESNFYKNIKNDFYKESIPEFENNLSKIDIKKEKLFHYFNPNKDNSNSYIDFLDDYSKKNDISYSFYDPDLEKTIKNLSDFYNKDNSSFSNKKRGRSPKFEKDLKNNQTKKMNQSDDVIYRKNKNNLFNILNNSNKGRKKKDSGLKGRHDKYFFDNISKGIKSLSFDYIREELNSELDNINNSELINYRFLKFNNKQAINSSKEYNKALMQKTFKEIFSEKISGKYNNEEDYNKKLIDKIYKINEAQKDEKIERLIIFFDLKFIDFWAILSKYINTKDKQKYLGIINDKYSFFKGLIKNFIPKVDEILIRKKADENYKALFKLLLEDFHLRF